MSLTGPTQRPLTTRRVRVRSVRDVSRHHMERVTGIEPEQELIHTLRPAYTLSRAALEAASQAVWVSAGGSAAECARRHLRLIRWDYAEHRKSVQDPAVKQRIRAMDETLLTRVEERLSVDELIVPSLIAVLRDAAQVIGVSADELERVSGEPLTTTSWRAASERRQAASSGRRWRSKHVVPVDRRARTQADALP